MPKRPKTPLSVNQLKASKSCNVSMPFRCTFHLAKGRFSDNQWLELRGRGRGLEPVISSIEGLIWSTIEFKHLNCRITETPKLVMCFDNDLAQGYLN
ncbi:hypothetical protein LguiA_005070 [Lonicera macranthoides]